MNVSEAIRMKRAVRQFKDIRLNENDIKINHDIPMGHKFALKDINQGDLIKKYGQIIGIAVENVKIGDWIHTHNVKSHYLERVAND